MRGSIAKVCLQGCIIVLCINSCIEDYITSSVQTIIGPICLGYVAFCSTGKIHFIFGPVDGMIDQVVDMENERFRVIEAAHFGCHEHTRHYTNLFKIFGCMQNWTWIIGSQSRRSPTELAGRGLWALIYFGNFWKNKCSIYKLLKNENSCSPKQEESNVILTSI